ncbi:hypothetical protein SLS56_012060 [Neofusicoccum ribis]|uniref:BTB domain-containing protein n=1 Tax=Neofusicoccum ribis TaxID=45134 RepID=A0ABR3S9X3_9PEZI
MGASQSSQEAFMRGIANLFNSTLYSDVQVRCKNGDTYPCHTVVLCTQSKFLAQALDPKLGSKGSQGNIITISDEDPMIVKAVLEFLYRFDYSVPKGMSLEAQLDLHIRIYNVGKFQDVEGLRDTTKFHFLALLEETYKRSMFGTAVRLAYGATTGSDHGLKDILVECAMDKFDELKKDQKFLDVMSEVSTFSRDLALAISKGKVCENAKVQSSQNRVVYFPNSPNLAIHQRLYGNLRNFICNALNLC